MNQSFKKKVIAASVAATFVAVGAGFVAIPGIAPISAAQANQFADTAQAAAVSAGVSVPKSATAALTGQTFTITESTGGAISPGQIILTPTNGAKFVSATQASTTAGGGTAIALQPNQVDSSGNLILSVSASSTAGPTGTSTIALTSIVMDTSAVTVGNTVSVSISSSSTTTGITSGVSTTLATVQAAGATITADATTVPTYPKLGSTVIANTITVAEVIMGSVKGLTSTTDEITVTLPTGYTFLTAGTTASTDDFTTDSGTITSNVVKYDVTGAATTAAGKKVIIGNPTVFIPSTATDGNVDATVAVKLSDGTTTKTTTVTLFKVASAASTNVAYTTGTTTAPTTYASLYAGRATQDTGLDVAVKESVGGTLLAGGTVSLTLPTGVTAGKNYAVTTDVSSDGTGVPALTAAVTAADGTDSEDGKNSIMATLAGTDTNVTAGKVTFKLNDIDLADTAVVGDLNVTVGGSSNATAGTVKVATVIRATDSSVSGTTPTVTAGSSLSLPDIVITESKAGALVGAGALMGVYIASANGANLTTTGATVTAHKADGTDVSTTIFGAASATLTAGANGLVTFPVTTASTSSTGPVNIKISGLKATLLSSAGAGDVTALVGGASGTTDITLTSDEGAKAFKQTVTVGKVVAATVPSIPAATATGTSTALTLSGSVVAAGNDQGKIGTLFVVAVLPNGQIYSRDSAGAWTLWDGVTAFKAVQTGVTLGTHSVDILSTATNVSSIVGTQVYLGYGIGALGTSAYTNLLANATYAKVYTVQ